jgi:hypothetical protein
MKRFVQLALFLSGFALMATAASAQMQAGKAKVFITRGDVKLVNNMTGKMTPLSRGMEFTDNNTVVTGANGTALLLFSNGASVNVQPNSKLNISNFKQEPFDARLGSYAALQADPSASDTDLMLAYGEVAGEVKKLTSESEYTVRTPSGAAGIRGTQWYASYDPNTNRTEFINLEGNVVVFAEGNVVPLEPGTVYVSTDPNIPGEVTVVTPTRLNQIRRDLNTDGGDTEGDDIDPPSDPQPEPELVTGEAS